MRIPRVAVSLLLALWGSTLAYAAAQRTYYLALGDSLALGVQPSGKGGDVVTNQGYVDDLYAGLRTRIAGLALAKLGCPGETTTTMMKGGICSYAAGSQLKAAVNFIETHHVGLITIDIGANDIDHCISAAGIDQACVETALATVGSNLPKILTELRTAAGPDTPIIGMNYYNPFLAVWITGAAGQALAKASEEAADVFNSTLRTAYKGLSVPVADVAHAYHIDDFTVIPFINLPVNVFLTLSWTWMGAPAPFGPDVHPNAAGYAVIAGAFAEKIVMQ